MSLATLARKTKAKQRLRTRGKFILNMTGRGNVLGMNAKMSRGNCKGLTKCAGKRAGCCVGVGGESDCCRFPHGGKPAPQMGYRVYLNRKSKGAYQPAGGKQCVDISGCIQAKTVWKKSHDTSASEITQKKKEKCLWAYNIFGKRCVVKEVCDCNFCCNEQNDTSVCNVKKSFSNKSTDLVRYTRMNVSCGITKSLPYNQAGHQITKIKSLAKSHQTYYSTINTYFIGSQNNIFNIAKSHNIEIVNSGTGTGSEDYWGGLKIGNAIGNQYLGFNSTGSPYPVLTYLAFSKSNNAYPTPLVSMCDNVLAHVNPTYGSLASNGQGRYVQSKNLHEMNIYKDVINKRLKITSWEQLEEITVVWCAGNNENGGDIPDVKKINDTILQESQSFRAAENLGIEFYDNNNNCIGNPITLWATKREPTADEYITAFGTNISPFDATLFGNHLQLYIGNQFTTTVIKREAFGNLNNASFFTIGQPRHTDTKDNYGVKYVGLKFKYQI